MCLNTLDRTPEKTPKYAWKVFVKRDDELVGYHDFYRNNHKTIAYSVGKWITSIPILVFTEGAFCHDAYKTGFHCYTTRKAARNSYICKNSSRGEFSIRKVKCAGKLLAHGIQYGLPVVVVEKILIP